MFEIKINGLQELEKKDREDDIWNAGSGSSRRGKKA